MQQTTITGVRSVHAAIGFPLSQARNPAVPAMCPNRGSGSYISDANKSRATR